MGYYINPPDKSKEAFLMEHGTPIAPWDALDAITPETLPVCLVSNGAFNAAGIAYSPDEVEAFSGPQDIRPKLWFKVSREVLKPYYDRD